MWNKEEYIKSLLPQYNKMVTHLLSKNIEVKMQEPFKQNLIFYNKTNNKEFIISFHSVFRYSGRTVYYKETETTMQPFELTYEGYLNTIIKPLIEKILL